MGVGEEGVGCLLINQALFVRILELRQTTLTFCCGHRVLLALQGPRDLLV